MIHESPDGGKTIKSREMNLPNHNSSNNCDTSQTAVEWLFQKLWDTPKDKFTWYAILEQAKEMEKQQMFGFTNHHQVIGEETERFFKEEFELWYNETYGSKGSHNSSNICDTSSQTETPLLERLKKHLGSITPEQFNQEINDIVAEQGKSFQAWECCGMEECICKGSDETKQ